jgi:hypothetical protein
MKKTFAALASALLVSTAFAQTAAPAPAPAPATQTPPQKETAQPAYSATKEGGTTQKAHKKIGNKKHVAPAKADTTKTEAINKAGPAQASADKAKVHAQNDATKTSADVKADVVKKQ